MPDRPTVAVDLRALVPEPTGIGVYTREVLAALAARGGMRYLGLAHRSSAGVEAVRALGVEVEIQPAPLGVLWQQTRLPWRLRRGDVDLLFSPIFTLPVACPLPAVATVADLTIFDHPETHHWKVKWSLRPVFAATLRRARRVLVISQSVADGLDRLFPGHRGKTRVVHLGVSPAFAPADAGTVARIRAEEGAEEGYIFFASTLQPRKNLDRLLAAWEGLRREDSGFPPLLIAGGSGWRSAATRERFERLRPLGLRYLGRVDDERLVRLFRGAKAFVYPSLDEGFGLPVIEAMACGVPVVASDLPVFQEVAGGAAELVDPYDVGSIAEGLERVVSDPARAADLAAAGLERAKRFTWERTAELTEEVFRDVLAEG